MDNIQEKIALVTGGGSGINLAFVQLLASAGCRVLIADLALHPFAQQWINSLPPASAKAVQFQQTDVTKWDQLAKTFDSCVEHFGDVPDIVVPGAGVYEPSSNTFWLDNDEESESRYKVIDIDLIHPIKLTRIAIRKMLAAKKRQGAIVHVSSIAGQRSSIITPLYTVSKHGINAFVRGLAPLEAMVGIRVVGVAPGTVATPLFTEHPEAVKLLDLEKDFLLPPSEIARAMFALLTDSKYKAGTILEVCDVEGRWRETNLLHDPGPQGPASTSSRKSDAIQEVMDLLALDAGELSSRRTEGLNLFTQ